MVEAQLHGTKEASECDHSQKDNPLADPSPIPVSERRLSLSVNKTKENPTKNDIPKNKKPQPPQEQQNNSSMDALLKDGLGFLSNQF